MLDIIAAAAQAVGAAGLVVATPFVAWWCGVWFRARGAQSGTFPYGFEGSTADRIVCAALLTMPWPWVALASETPAFLPVPAPIFDAVATLVVFALNFAAVSLAHGNYFSLGERSAAASKPEPPMSWLLGPEAPGLDEDARTRHQTKGAAIRIILLLLPSILAAIWPAWPVALLLLGAAALTFQVARLAAKARLGQVDVDRLRRRLRVDRWGEDTGMRRGWELLEFMAGAWAGYVSAAGAGLALAWQAACALAEPTIVAGGAGVLLGLAILSSIALLLARRK